MGRACRHSRVDGLAWSKAYPRWYARFKARRKDTLAEALVCIDCGAWLSLGPSNDTPAAMVELEAARLVALYQAGKRIPHNGSRGRGTFTGCAGCGWNAQHRTMPFLDGKPNTDAGYLARHIATHEETT